jgi:hypothetical protein
MSVPLRRLPGRAVSGRKRTTLSLTGASIAVASSRRPVHALAKMMMIADHRPPKTADHVEPHALDASAAA